MASFSSFCLFTCWFVLLMIMTCAPASMAAEEFKVGGAEGWRQPPAGETDMYAQWASANTFRVGDSLRFKYKNDTVEVVDKWGYYHCNSTRPVSVFKDGDTVIKLDKPGGMFFVSGDPDHCKTGQRLMVDVLTLHQITPSPPAASNAGAPWAEPTVLVLFYTVLVAAFTM